jgi:cytochrome oxidase assembly protein ShyY1
MIRDSQAAREWLVVVGLGIGGLALAALTVLTPWQVGGRESDEVVVVDVTAVSGSAQVLSAPRDPR